MPSFKRAHETAGTEDFKVKGVNEVQSPAVSAYLRADSGTGSHEFQIDSRVSQMIGLSDLKKTEEKKAFDGEVFRYVQKIKDGAFQEAYDKGLVEGAEKAKIEVFDSLKAELTESLTALNDIVSNISDVAKKVYQEQEEEIVAFAYMLAKKIVYKEIEKDPELFLHTIKNILHEHEVNKERATVKISKADYDFVQENIARLSLEFDLNKLKIEADEKLERGDVILENPQGVVDGRLSTRIEKLQRIFSTPE